MVRPPRAVSDVASLLANLLTADPQQGETGVILGRGFLGKVRDLFLHHS